MGTKSAVQCANLSVAYLEVKMFALLPTVYPADFVDFLIRNYFRFLDDLFHLWLEMFDIRQFYEIFESLDEDLKFIFAEIAAFQNYLDIHFRIEDNTLVMDIYYKPTNSFNFLLYTSCHPRHTKDNIALSLGKRIVRIVSENRDARLNELKDHLIAREHPPSVINRAFTRIMEPPTEKEDKEALVFVTTHNPTRRYDKTTIKNILEDTRGDSMKKAFSKCRVIASTRQPPSLRKSLVKSKFSLKSGTPKKKATGLFACRQCKYHELKYIKRCRFFRFGKINYFKWVYTRFFNCDSENVIYILICSHCWEFYIGETEKLKQRTRKHISDVKHPNNTNCLKLVNHLRKCGLNKKEPYFHIYPIYYVQDKARRKFLEKRFQQRYKPTLNGDN